jgi:hypothetical protein
LINTAANSNPITAHCREEGRGREISDETGK